MSFEGKTIARIEERPADVEHGYPRDDRLLLHFTDGTALEVSGWSYEEVSLDYRAVSAQERRRMARAATGHRELQRLQRLQRAELAALPEEERAARDAARRANMSPMGRMMEDSMRAAYRDLITDISRQTFGATIEIPVQKRGRARRS